MEGKNYYSLTTRRFTLRCNRREWLESTQLFYNRIRSQLSYKAWQQGILVLEADANRTGSSCAKCGAPVKRNDDEFSCPNGHKGSRYVNTCVNLGRKCRDSFERNSRKHAVKQDTELEAAEQAAEQHSSH